MGDTMCLVWCLILWLIKRQIDRVNDIRYVRYWVENSDQCQATKLVTKIPSHLLLNTQVQTKAIKEWEPWSSIYGRSLMFWRSWFRILSLITGWTFFTFICYKKMYCLFEKNNMTNGPFLTVKCFSDEYEPLIHEPFQILKVPSFKYGQILTLNINMNCKNSIN